LATPPFDFFSKIEGFFLTLWHRFIVLDCEKPERKTMKLEHTMILSSIAFAAALLVTPVTETVWAGALNEKRILRKAGGPSQGTIDFVATVTPAGDPTNPVTLPPQVRTGSLVIPRRKGRVRARTIHGPDPNPSLDTVTSGRLGTAKVSRNGKRIRYVAPKAENSYFDGDGAFKGRTNAVTKIQGKRTVTTARFQGQRVNASSGDTESAVGKAKGKGRF